MDALSRDRGLPRRLELRNDRDRNSDLRIGSSEAKGLMEIFSLLGLAQPMTPDSVIK